MNRARKILLITTASLALIDACHGRGTNSGRERAWGHDAPATLATIMRDYNTAASQHLKSLEADFNRICRPAFPPSFTSITTRLPPGTACAKAPPRWPKPSATTCW